MNRSSDVDLVLREYLADDGLTVPDRVLHAVEQRIGRQPQRRRWRLRRRPFMSTYAKVIAAAAVVVVVAVVGYSIFALGPGPGGTASPSPTTLPTVEPTSAPAPTPTPSPTIVELRDGTLPAGRYRVRVPHSNVDAVLTLPTGWSGGGFSNTSDSYYVTSAIGSLSFWTVGNVGADACDNFGTTPSPPIGPTVEEFVAALEAQRNSDTTAPEVVLVGGRSATRLDIRPAADASCPELLWWGYELERGRGAEAGQALPDTIYAVDVDGQRIVIVAFVIGQQQAFDDILATMELSRG